MIGPCVWSISCKEISYLRFTVRGWRSFNHVELYGTCGGTGHTLLNIHPLWLATWLTWHVELDWGDGSERRRDDDAERDFTKMKVGGSYVSRRRCDMCVSYVHRQNISPKCYSWATVWDLHLCHWCQTGHTWTQSLLAQLPPHQCLCRNNRPLARC